MKEIATPYRVGDATIIKIPEITLDEVGPSILYPDVSPTLLKRAAGDVGPGSVDHRKGLLRQSIHTWLVRTPEHIILVDTSTGNDKERPSAPVLDRLDQPFLDRLKAVGVNPGEVDYILFTHLHADHVGWNTQLIDGRWDPTFKNARHIFSRREQEYQSALAARDGSDAGIREMAQLGRMSHLPMPGVFEDSVAPIVEAGLADEILVDGSEVLEGFSFLPSPGHSIDHASISFTSQGEHAFFWGDVLHHPIQVAHQDINSVFCEFPDAAVRSRNWALNQAADSDALVFTTHFAESSAGRVRRDREGFHWQFI
jgi:glyoxylase-like metal-dependent hydrolase (beta-lactamase superfamily II)